MTSRKTLLASSTAQTDARPLSIELPDMLGGDSASAAALARLEKAVRELKARAVEPLLARAVAALKSENAQVASELALEALGHDERNGLGWYLLAIAREKAGDFAFSVRSYEKALALLPDEGEIANDLGRLAYRMGLKDVAEKLFRHYMAAVPGSYEGANNLACVLRDNAQYAEAIEMLRPAIVANPEVSLLWNTMGTILAEQGDPGGSVVFYDEALRLDPAFAKARYNRGNARLALGHADEALEDCDQALAITAAADERAMMKLARSTIHLALGDIRQGWEDYEARHDMQFADMLAFAIDRPGWTPETELSGKTLLVFGEQGLGDEILFANLLPEVIEALGPNGKLMLAVEKRLVPLFQRSFPSAEVGAHITATVQGRTVRAAPFVEDTAVVDCWAPIGSLLRRFRTSVEAYPNRPAFMAADPARVAHWRGVLAAEAPAGPKVGVLWKSLKIEGARSRFFSPFDAWAPVLRTPGVSFVNLQYGDCAAEIARAHDELGVTLWTPPGIDLKADLDDVAALSAALDLTIGFANATSNIAAAVGAPVWLISTPAAWPRLGTDRYPWYPQAQVFLPPGFGQWEPAMDEVAAALAGRFR